MLKIRHFIILSGLVMLAACSPAAEPTPTLPQPTETPVPIQAVTQNADWTPITETINGLEMVLVPPGCFMMGSDDGRRDERPASELCFDQAYYIGRTEVTNAQFGSQGNFAGDNRPRENLPWIEARDFCASKGMRLPTEAEWEYAARGPSNLHYPWGDEFIVDNAVVDSNSNNETADVGSRPAGASWVGALDMSGNVFEWVSSIYARYPYDGADGRENPDDTELPRVFRGGVNTYIDFGASAHTRFNMPPGDRDWFIGFRCALSR